MCRILTAISLVLVMASTGFGYALPQVAGNWEGTNMDGWIPLGTTVAVPGRVGTPLCSSLPPASC